MTSMIFTIPELDTSSGAPDITPDQEHKLLDGMREFGREYLQAYTPGNSENESATAIALAMSNTINLGAAAYFHDGTQYIRVYQPSATGPIIHFKNSAAPDADGSPNQIRVAKDNPHQMVVAAPIGDMTNYRDAFVRQTVVEYVTKNQETFFFAAAVLISRCK